MEVNGNDLIFECLHESEVEKEGYIVCTLCGFVLETQTFINKESFESKEKQIWESAENYFDPILELVEKDIISREVYDLAMEKKKEMAIQKKPKRAYHELFAIYFASRMLNYPLTLSTLCDVLNVPFKKISEVEKHFNFTKSNSCEVYLNKYCKILKIPQNQLNEIKDLVIFLENRLNTRPLTIVAGVIKLKFENLSFNEISNIFSISRQTLDKFCKKVKMDYPDMVQMS